MSKTFAPSKARPILRKRSIINIALTASAQVSIIHTVTDAETLVRTRVSLYHYGTASGSTRKIGTFIIAKAPAGNSVVSAGTSTLLDQSVTMEDILRIPSVCFYDTTNGLVTIDRIELDTKAMRKLKPGDEIHWISLAKATGSEIYVFIDQWFKQ